jgi:hypothetical protein
MAAASVDKKDQKAVGPLFTEMAEYRRVQRCPLARGRVRLPCLLHVLVHLDTQPSTSCYQKMTRWLTFDDLPVRLLVEAVHQRRISFYVPLHLLCPGPVAL